MFGAPLREITGRIRRLRLRPGQLSRPGAQRPVLVPALDYAAPYGTRTRGAVRRVSGSLRNAVQGVAQHTRPPARPCLRLRTANWGGLRTGYCVTRTGQL